MVCEQVETREGKQKKTKQYQRVPKEYSYVEFWREARHTTFEVDRGPLMDPAATSWTLHRLTEGNRSSTHASRRGTRTSVSGAIVRDVRQARAVWAVGCGMWDVGCDGQSMGTWDSRHGRGHVHGQGKSAGRRL